MSDPRTDKARLADDLEALRLMVSLAHRPICDIAGDTLTRAIAAIEAHMPDGEVETFQMWAVQTRMSSESTWETDRHCVVTSEDHAVEQWDMLREEGREECDELIEAGLARTVRVTITAPTGED